VPTATEEATFLTGLGTPAVKPWGACNSERAESCWYRFSSSFLVILVHFSAVVRDACGVSHHRGTHQLLYSFIPAPAPQRFCSQRCPRPLPPGRASPRYLGRGRRGRLFISGDPPALPKRPLMHRSENTFPASFLALLERKALPIRRFWEGPATPARPQAATRPVPIPALGFESSRCSVTPSADASPVPGHAAPAGRGLLRGRHLPTDRKKGKFTPIRVRLVPRSAGWALACASPGL